MTLRKTARIKVTYISNHLELLSVPRLIVSELDQAKYVTTAFNSKQKKYEQLEHVIRVLMIKIAQEIVMSRCCCAENCKEMYIDS